MTYFLFSPPPRLSLFPFKPFVGALLSPCLSEELLPSFLFLGRRAIVLSLQWKTTDKEREIDDEIGVG